jgi:uncharacterized protein DUF4185
MKAWVALPLVFATFTACSYSPPTAQLHRQIPYPRSTVIERLVWESRPSKYPGSGSDMHWWTWGIDGSTYVVDDDGKNFDGPGWYAHVLKSTGVPPDHKVGTVTDFQSYDFRKHLPPGKLIRRYVAGAVAVDSALYVAVYDYDWNIPNRSARRDRLRELSREYHPWGTMAPSEVSALGFIDGYSKLYGVAGIIASNDHGATWTNLPGKDTPEFFGARFGAPAFLTFGPGNTETPAAFAPYVYAISNDVSWATGDNVFLGRVHRDRVIERDAWEFYDGTDAAGDARWTKDENEAKPIFTDPDHVGHPTITYNKGLGRFILLVSSDMVPHKEDSPPEVVDRWNLESEMQLYEGPTPWGPWSIFHDEVRWGGDDHTHYLPQMPASWLGADGLSGSLLFAGDYVKRKAEHYGFMTQQFRLVRK